MAPETARERKLAVLLHADVVSSTRLVQQNEVIAHARITDAFNRFSVIIQEYGGTVHEIRGDALVAELQRASDAVIAAIAFQVANTQNNREFDDGVVPKVRVGISLGEVVIADGTVTGPGIVLAQRVEQLAAPGGVCVTSAVHEAIPDRLPFAYDDLGEQSTKGFDNPVRVYAVELKPGEGAPEPDPPRRGTARVGRRWVAWAAMVLLAVGGALAWLQPWQSEFEPARPDRMEYALPDYPSIAVLPFDNFSNEPGDERLVDGFTENLTSVIARLPSFLVTARNSAFRFRGGNSSIREVAEALSVRYVLEGSLQRSNEQLRVTVQLIDAVVGKHLWAETYDRQMTDFFKLSDDIALQVARELSVQLTVGDAVSRETTDNLEAFLHASAGWAQFAKFSPESNLKARTIAKEVIELDENYSSARTMLAWTFAVGARLRWDKNVEDSWNTAEQLSNQLIDDSPEDPGGYEVLAYVQQFKDRDYAKAERLYEQALEKDPSRTSNMAMLASATLLRGKWEKTIQLRRKAMRLRPIYPTWYLFVLGFAHVFNGENGEALKVAKGGLARESLPSFQRRMLHSVAIQAHVAAGDLAEAKIHAEAILALDPKATVERLTQRYPFENPAHAAVFKERFLAAGLPAGGK